MYAQNPLHMPRVPISEAEILNNLKFLYDSQGNRLFATDLQGCILVTDSGPRTGTFSHMRVTLGDTFCSVNGV